MNWIYFALSAAFLYCIVKFIDKFILERRIRDFVCIPIYCSFLSFIFGLGFWYFNGFQILSTTDTILALMAGIFIIAMGPVYFAALNRTSASNIIILIQLIPVFTLVLSVLFLGDRISITQLAGFFLIIASVIGISMKRESTSLKINKAFFLILIVDIMSAIAAVITKWITLKNPYIAILPYNSFGIFLGGILMLIFFKRARIAFFDSFVYLKKSSILFIIFNESLFIFTQIVHLIAISLASVALVSVVISTQVFIGVMMGTLLAKISPTTFKEATHPKDILIKIFFAVLTFLGVFLVY
jgi:drug/metabolite transporter (DMT)-like permease